MTQVLLVEPDSALRKELKTALHENGYRVESAEGMSSAIADSVQILVCDDRSSPPLRKQIPPLLRVCR